MIIILRLGGTVDWRYIPHRTSTVIVNVLNVCGIKEMPSIQREELIQRYAAGERDFSGSELLGELYNVDLSGANLNNSRLDESYFERAVLKRVTMRNTRLNQSCLERADLTGADLRESDLRYARFDGADLTEADLRKARLFETCFRKAKLIRTNLSGVELRNCNLREADLTGANLEGVKFRGVIFDNTIMPNGSIRNST